MRRFELDLFFSHPPRRVVELFTDPAFLEAEARMQGSFSARCEVVEEGPPRRVLRVHHVAPDRDPRSRARESRFHIQYEWNLEDRTCGWLREPETPDDVQLSGTHQAHATVEGGCRYHMAWELDLEIRIMKRILEKRLEAGLREGAHKRAEFVRNHLDR